MKRAVATTTPIINSYVSWKASSQKRVTKWFAQQRQEEAEAEEQGEEKASPVFTAGESVPSSSMAAGIFDAAGNELRFDDDTDDFKPVLDTAFDAKVWQTIGNDKKATASELQEVITGMTKGCSSADWGND